MNSSSRILAKERKTIRTMIRMYCKSNPNPRNQFCEDCLELFKHANKRLKHFRFGDNLFMRKDVVKIYVEISDYI